MAGPARGDSWTAGEIRERLGISPGFFPTRMGSSVVEEVSRRGIRRIEIFGYGPRSHYDFSDSGQVREIRRACREHGVSIVSVHAPNVPFASEYEGVRKAAVREGLRAARVAVSMGAGIFIGHFGVGEQGERTVRELLEALDGTPLRIANENGADLRDYVRFTDRIGSDRFGMVVDVGYTRDADRVNPFVKKGRARECMAQCGARLFHVHLHDFTDRDHEAPFTGTLQWDEIFAALRDIDYKGTFLFEPGHPSPDVILEKTAGFPEEFVRRYAGGGVPPSAMQ